MMASVLSASWHPSSADAQTALRRHQAHLEAQLQDLLDAQSEGLLAGLTGAVIADERSSSSTGTATPTSATAPSSSVLPLWPTHDEDEGDKRRKGARGQAVVMPVNQPRPRPVSLQRARRGITRTIAELAALKSSEIQTLSSQAEKRSEVVGRIKVYMAKEDGLAARIERIEADAPNTQLAEMKREEGELAFEIHTLETRLYEMKAQHRVLQQRVEEAENGVRAKLSSWERSLELHRLDIARFLAQPPPGLESAASEVTQTGREVGKKKGPWALPPHRRTLRLVLDHYKDEEKQLQDQIRVAEKETKALEGGAEIWGQVLRETQGVEEALKSEMEELATPTAHDDPEAKQVGMRRILDRMSAARAVVQQKFHWAEDRGWNLLVCCIGAELEALNEGYRVLEAASSQASSAAATRDRPGGESHSGSFEQGSSSSAVTTGHEGRAPQGKESDGQGRLLDVYEDVQEEYNDGPSADLLVSQHEDL